MYGRLHPTLPLVSPVYTSASPVTRWRNSCNPLPNQKITRCLTKVTLARFRTALSRNSDDRLENSQPSPLLSSDQQHFGALIRGCFLKWFLWCTPAVPQEFKSSISDALRLFGSPRAMAMPQSLTSIMEKCLIIYEFSGRHEACSFAVSRPVFPPRV